MQQKLMPSTYLVVFFVPGRIPTVKFIQTYEYAIRVVAKPKGTAANSAAIFLWTR